LSATGRNLRTTSLLGSNCAGTTATSAELALRRLAYCERDDVRGVARDAACDIGAFEF